MAERWRSWIVRVGPLVPVLVLAFCVLWRAPHFSGESLLPRADALDYAVVAHRLAAFESPGVPIGDQVYPSRYPVGFPLLLVPAVLTGSRPDTLWHACALFALAGVALTYLAAFSLAGLFPAAWSALCLALSPLYVRYALVVMSDAPAAALTAAWAILLLAEFWGALGLVAGFACGVRLLSIVLLVVGALAALWRGKASRFALGAAAGFLPQAICVAAGWSNLLGGYTFWMPERYAAGHGVLTAAFSLTALRDNMTEYGGAILGLGHAPLYPWPVLLIALVGLRRPHGQLTRRGPALIVLALLLHLGLAFAYFYHDVRLLLPAVPLMLILSACGLAWLRARSPIGAAAIALLVLGLQARAVRHVLREDHPKATMASTLLAVAPHLPSQGVVVSDVAAPLAWLYWIRGTPQHLLPVAVPAHGMPDGPLQDRHLWRLQRNAEIRQAAAAVPATFLADGELSAAGRMALQQGRDRERTVIVVLCTPSGRHELAPIISRLSSTRTVMTDKCDVLRVRAKRSPGSPPRLTVQR